MHIIEEVRAATIATLDIADPADVEHITDDLVLAYLNEATEPDEAERDEAVPERTTAYGHALVVGTRYIYYSNGGPGSENKCGNIRKRWPRDPRDTYLNIGICNGRDRAYKFLGPI